MTVRILPPAEWARLAGTEAQALWKHLDPERAKVVVVEEHGQIIATHTLMWVLHAECLWVHPGWRGRLSVLGRLWMKVQAVARAMGARTLMTAQIPEQPILPLLQRVGAKKLDGDHFVVSI